MVLNRPQLPRAMGALLDLAGSTAPGVDAQRALIVLTLGADAIGRELALLTPGMGFSEPRLSRIAKAVREARRALQDAGKTSAKQHITSQVLLGHFSQVLNANDGPQLISFEKLYGKWQPRSPAAVAYVENFVAVDSARVEAIWNETETNLGSAIQTVVEGRLGSNPTAAATIRDAVALHIARNPATRDIHDALFSQLIPFNVNDIVATPALWWLAEEAYFREKQIRISTNNPTLLREGAELFYSHVVRIANDGYTYRFRVESNFRKMQDLFASKELEIFSIAASSPGQFLVTDAGALPVNLTTDKVGWSEGVAMGNAEKVILPLAPSVLVSVGTSSGSHVADHAFVDKVNRLQLRAARERVLFHPSALGGLPTRSDVSKLSASGVLPPMMQLLVS